MAKALLNLAGAISRYLPSSIRGLIYRLGPISALIRAMLNRVAPSGLATVEIAAGGLEGLVMQLDLQIEKDYWLGSYESNLQRALSEHVTPGMVIYDLGANIGYISLLAARLTGEKGRVFSFEALPSNQERLRKNIRLNAGIAAIELEAKAAAEKSGKANFLVHHSGGMGKMQGSDGRDEAYQQEIEVETISLDDFVFVEGNQAPNLIKIDIEGGEDKAIRGMEGVLKKHRPTLFLELHGQKVAAKVWEILSSHAYSMHSLQRGYPNVASYQELDWKSYLMAVPE
jgi:FkbM family methyltransferase